VICDTGSTDNTKEVIASFFNARGIKGEILDHKWVDFGHNRSLALQACYGKTQWALMIDADDSISGNFPIRSLDSRYDAYNVVMSSGSVSWKRVQIFNLKNKKWRYEEPLHEYATCDGEVKIGDLNGDYKWTARAAGGRLLSAGSSREKYTKDYLFLKKYLIENPNQPRKQFYAAQSAFDAEYFELAEIEFLKRVELGAWEEEIFYSWYKIGMCREILKRPEKEIVEAYINAYEACPHRAESLCKLSLYFRLNGNSKKAFIYANAGVNIPLPRNSLFVEEDCYSWRMLDEVGATAFYVNRHEIGLQACQKLLANPHTPLEHRERILSNLNLYKQNLKT
jgi:glycosyltransferase involved in cell wall biosynthesis